MLKRTKGRLLLTLLVVTGFAGTLTTSSLGSKERKVIVVALKENKTELIKNVRNLSSRQLLLSGKGKQCSIREHFEHIAATEAVLWDQLESAMLRPAKPGNRTEITLRDEDILNTKFNADDCVFERYTKKQDMNQSIQATINEFKASRSKQLKYIKTTTEDLRNRVVETRIGTIDCYQLLLYIPLHSNAHLDEIAAALKQLGFLQNTP